MPFLHIRPSQMDVQLSRALGGMSQDLLEDGRGATGLNPEGSSGVAEEVGGELGRSARGKEKAEPLGDSAVFLTDGFCESRTAGWIASSIQVIHQVNHISSRDFSVSIGIAADWLAIQPLHFLII